MKKRNPEILWQRRPRYEIRLSGSGGQGIIMAAIVLAEAAGVYGKRHVAQTQSYGPEARGGASKADVVIAEEPIDYPNVTEPDLLLAMNQYACDTYFPHLRPEGLLVVDATLVQEIPTSRCLAVPFTQMARKELGNVLVANMVALGMVNQLARIVGWRSLESALAKRVPRGTEEINGEALRTGMRAAKKINLDGLPPTIAPGEEQEV